MSSNEVVKTVAKKLKYYFEVKRLEDGFDLSGAYSPILDHLPLKARPTLQYDGLHDRALKHYFSHPDVRVNLTMLGSRLPSRAPREQHVKNRLQRYMTDYHFLLTGPELPPVLEKPQSRKSKRTKSPKDSLPDCYYIYSAGRQKLRPDLTGFGVPLKSEKRKKLKGGWPVLRSVPSNNVSRGEAERLVNAATKLLVATETVDHLNRPISGRQTAPRPFETGKPLPGIDDEEETLLHRLRKPTNYKGGPRPSTAKCAWDINGRRVRQSPAKAYDDSFLERRSGESSRRAIVRPRSPTPENSPSMSLQSSSTDGLYRLKTSQRNRPTSGHQPLSATHPLSGNRPVSAKYRSRTIINVPEARIQDEVFVQGGTQTQDEIGIQTEKRLIEHYDSLEDEVKQGPWGQYQIFVQTGNRIGASTKADIKITLYGDKGRTKEFLLKESKRHKIKFQKGKEDLFVLAAHHVGKLRKIKIGHDRPELSYGWFLEGVTVLDKHDKRIYEFHCDQWLSGQDGDKKTYRELPVDRDRALIEGLDSNGALDVGKKQDTSEDESEKIIVQQTSESVKAHPSQKETKSTQQDSESETETESDVTDSESSAEEEAVISVKQSPKKQNTNKKSKNDSFFDQKVKGPTFTFHSTNSSKVDERLQSEDHKTVKVEERTDGKSVQKEVDFLAGYKAGIDASNEQSRQHEEEERKKEHQLLQGPTIHDAARKGDLNRLKELLQHFPELKEAKDENGWTPLHLAAANGQVDILKWLTTSGVDLNIETPTGYTPIHVAALNGHVSALMILAAMGAAITCQTVDKQMPLHLAARGGYLECVKWLVANRARLDAEDNFGRTPLYLAGEYDQSITADFLRACEKELANPNSSFAQLHSNVPRGPGHLPSIEEDISSNNGDRNKQELMWTDDKASYVSQNAAAGSDEENEKVVRSHSPDIVEKKKLFEEQHMKMENRGMSFLDSIRQDIEGN